MGLLHSALLSKLLTMSSIVFGRVLGYWPLAKRLYGHTASGKIFLSQTPSVYQ